MDGFQRHRICMAASRGSADSSEVPPRGTTNSCLRVSFSNRQAVPGRACQWRSSPIQPVLSQMDKGRENQRLRQQNQSIKRPRNVAPTRMGKRTTRSRGPSSSARKDANLQLASAKRVKHQVEILLSISFHICRFVRGNGAPGPANYLCPWGKQLALLAADSDADTGRVPVVCAGLATAPVRAVPRAMIPRRATGGHASGVQCGHLNRL